MAFDKVLLLRLLCFIVICIGATQGIDENTKLTKATANQRLDINVLIQKWKEDSVVRNKVISTYAQIKGDKTKQTYRLDNEMPTETHAKLRIQSGKETYGVALIKIGVNHGSKAIRNALIVSVRDKKTVTLGSV